MRRKTSRPTHNRQKVPTIHTEMTDFLSPKAASQNSIGREVLKVQLVVEDFNDKENSLRLIRELGEERRNSRL